MDAKITKERLNRMLSYDWLKIVGFSVAAIIVWTLIFTMSATRITPAQQFTAINYFGNVGTINTKFSTTLSSAYKDGVFSYEVIELSEVDVGGNAEYGSTLMETRVATNEGDVVFVPNIPNQGQSYTYQGETVYDSYQQNLVRHYGYCLMNLDMDDEDGYFNRMERFLNRYYGGNFQAEDAQLNVETVRADFLARIQKNKDKRFKKSAEIEQGVLDECERLEKYRAGLIEFYGYLESGLVQLEKTTVWDYEEDKLWREGVYTINLCPDRATMPNLKNVTGYLQTVTGEDGEEQQVLCADNMHVAIMKFDEVESSFEYESLLYINYVIRVSKA